MAEASNDVTLTGGVDLVTPRNQVSPGRLLDCLNYEVGRYDGYTRIDGFSGWDGRASVNSERFYNFQVNGNEWDVAAGDTLALTLSRTGGTVATMTVVGVTTGSSPPLTYITAIASADVTVEDGDWDTLTDSTTSEVWGSSWLETVGLLPITVRADQFADFASDLGGPAGPVPGRSDAYVLCAHQFKDEVYSARDMTALEVSVQTVLVAGTEPVEGSRVCVVDQSWSALVVAVVPVRGDWFTSGSLMRLIVTDEYGVREDYESGAVTVGTALYVQADGWTIGLGGSPLGAGALGGTWADTVQYAIGTLTRYTDDTAAALWRGNEGWHRVDTLREVRFSGGGMSLEALAQYTKFAYSGSTTGDGAISGSSTTANTVTYTTSAATLPGIAFDAGAPLGGFVSWATPSNATADDNTSTTATLSSGSTGIAWLWVHGFDFSAIPDNATITGLAVSVERKGDTATATNRVRDYVVRVTGVGVTAVISGVPNCSRQNKADGSSEWPTSLTVKTYGAKNDLWGEDIKVAQVKHSNFGALVACFINTDGTVVASIDCIKIAVSYINANGTAYVYNGTAAVTASKSDIPIEVIKITKTAGLYSDSSAEGVITFRGGSHFANRIGGTDATGPVNGRQIAAANILYSARSGGGTAYCTIVGPDYAVTLPSQAEMVAAGSKYVCDNANFYATDDAESMYAANGAGPAFTWDGRVFIRIHTELLPALNTPRHVHRHGAHLALGYKQGMVLFSAITANGPDPLYYETGTYNVRVEEFGDAITGLVPLADDVLAVFCQSKIVALRGFTAEAFVEKVLSPNSGAIEYTAVDMGFGYPVFLDNFGVSSIETTNKFGGFEAGSLSHEIGPWLLPRVQEDGQFPESRPVCAIAVRAKNQYRVFFGDGAFLTMRLWGMERIPMFTFGRYADPRTTDYENVEVYPVFAASSSNWSDGRERTFFSTNYAGEDSDTGATQGTLRAGVYEMDVGRGFAGAPIHSYITFNWNKFGGANRLKRFDRWWLYGQFSGYASFTNSRAINYETPTYPVTNQYLTTTVGATSANVAFDMKPFALCIDFPVQGYDMSIRIDHTDTDFYGPIGFQGLSFDVDNNGESPGNRR